MARGRERDRPSARHQAERALFLLLNVMSRRHLEATIRIAALMTTMACDFGDLVPDLTVGGDIKLNERVSLRRNKGRWFLVTVQLP